MDFTRESNGFSGSFYEGTKNPELVVVAVGDGGMNAMSMEEEITNFTYLLGEGYSVLFLDISEDNKFPVNLDYGERAIKWILSYYGDRKVKLGMIGIGLGASYSLLCATRESKVSFVIAISPYDHVMEAYEGRSRHLRKSSFVASGEELTYSPFFILEFGYLRLLAKSLRDERYGSRRFYRYLYDRNTPVPTSRIPVEKMKADVLFLASEDDDIWASEIAVTRMCKVLNDNKYKYKIRNKIYENGSYILGMDIDKNMKWYKGLRKKSVALSRKLSTLNNDIKDSKIMISKFLKEQS